MTFLATQVDTEAAIAALHRSAETDEETMEAEDEAQLREMFRAQAQKVRRLDEKAVAADTQQAAEDAAKSRRAGGGADSGSAPAAERSNGGAAPAPAAAKPAKLEVPRFAVKPRIVVQPKRPAEGGGEPATKKAAIVSKPGGAGPAADGVKAAADGSSSPSGSGVGLLGLLGDYGGTDSD